MSHISKIVVTGPFNAGKTKFVKTISDIGVVTTERKISFREKGTKATTTVAMDYGRVQLGEHTLHLHGTPGQARFDFMWDILALDMKGLVMLVDSAAPDTFPEAREMLGFFAARHTVPLVIAANKQDAADAVRPERLRRALDLPAQTLIMPCVASRKTSVKQVLAQLVEMM
jgi:hypothetical protein